MTDGITANTVRSRANVYFEVLRINHWFKNIFVFIGSIAAFSSFGLSLSFQVVFDTFIVFFSSCLLSSVNYIINGIVDKPFDARHPKKRLRAIPLNIVKTGHLVIVAGILLIFSLTLSTLFLNIACTVMLLLFLLAGFVYNIRPIRSKDVPYIDVISEAINNPIRLLLGWFALAPMQHSPPWALIFLFWAFGCFLMTAKRYAEFRYLKEDSAGYRVTFAWYSERSLYLAMMFYIALTVIFFLLFSIEYHRRLLYGFPGIILFIVWFMVITGEEDSIVKEPENIYKRRAFFVYSLVFSLVMIWLSVG